MYVEKKFYPMELYNIGFDDLFFRIVKIIQFYSSGLLNALSEGARGLFMNLVGCIKTCPKWTYNKKSMQFW